MISQGPETRNKMIPLAKLFLFLESGLAAEWISELSLLCH